MFPAYKFCIIKIIYLSSLMNYPCLIKQYPTYSMLISQNKMKTESRMCTAGKKRTCTAPIKPHSNRYATTVGCSAGLRDRTPRCKIPVNFLKLHVFGDIFFCCLGFLYKKKIENHSISCLIVWFYGLDNNIYLRCLVS